MTIQQTTTAHGTLSWAVDQRAIAAQINWAKRNPAAIQADLDGMAQFFPHWLLVGAENGQIARCSTCHAPAVPTNGAFRCLDCRSEVTINGMAWIGQIPALSRPEPRFQSGREALATAGFGEVTIDQQTYLLVPLTVHYPNEWPNQEPLVQYNIRWLKTLKLPASNGSYHLISNGRACIYGYNQWFVQPMAS